MMRRAWIPLAVAAGCFNPHYGSGDLKCSGDKCPAGFHCATDGTCWKNGSDPAVPDLAIGAKLDGGSDLSAPADLTPGFDLRPTADLQPAVDLAFVDLLPVIKHQGDACLPSDSCDTGHCIDGFCCDSTCDNLCQACNVPGSEGACTTVPHGPPLGIGKSCVTSVPSCGGQCNGLNPTQCQYPGVTTVCSPSCATTTSETDHFCDGAGGCGAGTSTVGCTNNLVCSGGSCLTQCAQTSDCQATFACIGTSCVPACTDGIADVGETDVDCGGPCATKCAVNKGCSGVADCQTASCVSSFCQLVSGPPNWLPASPMPTARSDFAIGVGDDGRIYATGGFGVPPSGSLALTAVTERLDPVAGTWATGFAPMPTPAGEVGYATGTDGRIYVFGGANASAFPITTTNAQAYRASTNSWSTLTKLPTARSACGAAIGPDGLAYVVAGYDSSITPSGANEAYSFALGTWSTQATMPNARKGPGVATGADGRIYVMGGANSSNVNSPLVDAYDPTSNTWTQVASFTPRGSPTAVAAPDGRIYAIGGFGPASLALVEAYTPSTNTWVTAPSLTTARQELGATVGPDGRIFAVGGYATTNYSGVVEVYGPVTTLNPTSGKKGATVIVTGGNFAASAAVSVYWGGTGGTLLGSGVTNASGVITTPISVTIPNVSPAPYTVTVVDNRSQYPVTPKFTVTP